jgi:hypothetical protein
MGSAALLRGGLMVQFFKRELSIAISSAIDAVKAALEPRSLRYLFGLILAADLAILVIYCVWAWEVHFNLKGSYFYDKPFYSSVDGSLMETAGYFKEAACAVMLGIIASRRRSGLFAALCLLLFYILLDDSIRIHERFGAVLAARGVPDAFSQFVADGFDGIIPIGLVVLGWFRADRALRSAGSAILVSIAILLFFAVGIDTVHQMIAEETKNGQKFYALFEDGGELLSLTLVLATVTGVFLREGASRKTYTAGASRSDVSA